MLPSGGPPSLEGSRKFPGKRLARRQDGLAALCSHSRGKDGPERQGSGRERNPGGATEEARRRIVEEKRRGKRLGLGAHLPAVTVAATDDLEPERLEQFDKARHGQPDRAAHRDLGSGAEPAGHARQRTRVVDRDFFPCCPLHRRLSRPAREESRVPEGGVKFAGTVCREH